MLNVTSDQKNSNQNHREMPPHAHCGMATLKIKNNQGWQGHGETGTLLHCLWETVWQFLKILKVELLQDPSTSLLGINPKELKVES